MNEEIVAIEKRVKNLFRFVTDGELTTKLEFNWLMKRWDARIESCVDSELTTTVKEMGVDPLDAMRSLERRVIGRLQMSMDLERENTRQIIEALSEAAREREMT